MTHETRAKLSMLEITFMKLFKMVGTPYVGASWTSTQTAQVEVRRLEMAIVDMKERLVGQIILLTRDILSGVAADSHIVRRPTLSLRELIATGLIDPANSVYRAAERLQAIVTALSETFPHAASPIKRDADLSGDMAVQKWFEGITDRLPLLHPEARILQTYALQSRLATAALAAVAPTIASALVPRADGPVVNGAIGAAVNQVGAYMPGQHIMFKLAAGFTYAAGIIIPAGGHRVTITRRYVGVFHDIATPLDTQLLWDASPCIVAAEDAAGTLAGTQPVTFPGYIAPGAGNPEPPEVTRVITVSSACRLVFGATTTNQIFHVRLETDAEPGAVVASPDGVSPLATIADARFVDLIGGGNISANLRTLNTSGFDDTLAGVHLMAEAYTNKGIFNLLNLYYANHLKSPTDLAAALSTNFSDPLKSATFWLATTDTVGITKRTRQELWRKYYSLLLDMMELAKVDGQLSAFVMNRT